MEKKFSEVAIGEKFVVNGVEYTKSQEVRVSCCKSVNCHLSDNKGQTSFFPGDALVTVVNNG